jgi:hypothetical protein
VTRQNGGKFMPKAFLLKKGNTPRTGLELDKKAKANFEFADRRVILVLALLCSGINTHRLNLFGDCGPFFGRGGPPVAMFELECRDHLVVRAEQHFYRVGIPNPPVAQNTTEPSENIKDEHWVLRSTKRTGQQGVHPASLASLGH